MLMKSRLLTFLFCFPIFVFTCFSQDPEAVVAASPSLETTVVETTAISPAPAVPVPTTTQRAASPTPPPVAATAGVATTIATRTPQIEAPSAETAPVSELTTFQRFTVNDTIRQMAGISLVQNGGPGTVTGFNIRGLQSDHNIVLLNGRRLPPGLAGQYQLEFLEVSTLESVQVLKGAASSLYGAEAIGGVIDLQSTDARFVENNGLSIYSEGGSFHTFRSGGMVSFREGRLGGIIEAATISTKADRPRSDFENSMLRGDIALDLGEAMWFDLLGYVQAGEVLVPGSTIAPFGPFAPNPNFPENQRNFNDSYLISPRITIERDDWNFSTFYSYNQNTLASDQNTPFINFFTGMPADVDNELRQIGRETEAVFNYTAIDDATLTLGGGSYEYYFLQQPVGDRSVIARNSHAYRYTSAFGQADVDLPGQVNVIASVRKDDHDTYNDATTYSVAINKEIEATGTNLFAKKATGYRPPTGQDLIFIVNDQFANPAGINPGDLDPEESDSWEIGFRQSLLDGDGNFSVTYFENDFKNSLEVDPATFLLSTVDGSTAGFEIETEFEVRKGLGIYTNYTYLDTEVTGGMGNLSGTPGNRLARRPRHLLNAGIVFSADDWSFGTELHGEFDRYDRAAAPRFADNYITTRIFGSRSLNENLEIYGRVENLFDEEYIYTRGFKAPGFGIFGGVRMTFGE